MESHTQKPSIFINDEHIRAPKEDMTGAEIKALGSIPGGNRLYKEVHGPHPDTPIPDDTLVHLKNGDRFYDLPPGTKGDGNLPLVEQQIERLRQDYPDIIVTPQPDGTLDIQIPGVPVPPGWTKNSTRLLITVPPDYPHTRPQGCLVDPDLRPASGQDAAGLGTTNRSGRDWGSFCWNPNTWDASRDTLWKYVKFALSRLEDPT